MSKKQWMVLLMLFLMYLLLGASIFYHIESQLEMQNIEQAKQERIEINALLREHYVPSTDFEEILAKVSEYCGKSVYNYTEGEADRLRWDFYNSFYFSYTVVSTIGYGNLAPTNMLSRILMIFYGVVGIPMNGILLTQLGEFFGDVFVKAHRKYKSYKRSREHYNPTKLTSFETRKVGLAAQICAYLIPGFVMFIFFPAFLFSHYEGWTYDQAVYYAFVTLTTIGFGDIVAGQDNTKGSGVFFIMYKIFLIAWISFGLGYIVMIMTFIARGMRSKRIKGLEHRLAVNLKHTQSKIWNELHKEVNFLRRVFNELQLSKVKRVYVDEYEYEGPPAKLPRSNSFPDLRLLTYFGQPEVPLQQPRRRANSEVVPIDDQIARVVSETDLQRIDKTATFATHAMVQPAELLAKLVNILGYMPPTDDNDQPDADYRSEKDKEEPTTDWWYDTRKDFPARRSVSTAIPWRIGNEHILAAGKPRSRAASEVRLYETRTDLNNRNAEWTWSGTPTSKKIQELINAEAEESRQANSKAIGPKMSVFRSLGLSMPKTLIPRWKRQSTTKKAADIEAGIKGLERADIDRRDNYNSQNATVTQNGMPYSDDRRESISRRHYYTHTGANATDFYESSNLLEETSLADFLRALTVLHASVGTVPEKYVGKPRRKMGTASLTPPKLPSLFTLFSSPPPGTNGAGTHGSQTITTAADRRLSLNVLEKQQSGASTPSGRRGSFAFIKPRRRFSLRPVATPISPPTPPHPESPNLSSSRHPNGESKFIFESSKEPLIQMETAPGISSPMKLIPGSRRSSLRPIPSGVEMSETSPIPLPSGPPSKPLPRWKAGMLQRQIGQMNLRRRVRAFSLSDVQVDDQIRGKKPVLEPLDIGDTGSRLKKIRPEPLSENISKSTGDTVRKSVTLLSPKRGQIFWPAQDDEPLEMSATLSTTSTENIVTSKTVSDTNTVVPKDTSLTLKSELVNVTTPKPPKEESLSEVKVSPASTSEAPISESKDIRVSEFVKDSKKDSKASSTKNKSSDSKPRVSIEHYELLSEVKIEKPAENPFERYRAATSIRQRRDSDTVKDENDESKRKSGVNKRA